MFWTAFAGYFLAALLYGIAAVVVIAGRPSNARTRALAVAIGASSVWAGGLAIALLGDRSSPVLVIGLDALHLFCWMLSLLTWLAAPVARYWFIALSVAASLVAVGPTVMPQPFSDLGWSGYPGLFLMSLLGLIAAEQVYRNAQTDTRQLLRMLCLAAGGIAAVNLFVYAHATLIGAPRPLFWSLRGFAAVAVLPLLIQVVRTHTDWQRRPFVSRHVAFYSASLLGIGGYLLTMGIVAYVVRLRGQQWSLPLDLGLLVVGVGVLLYILFYSTIRASVKAFLLKHFYRNKYDYREAWLRLTQSLSRTGDLQQSAANALEGLARIIGSHRGDLWIERDSKRYEWLVSLGDGQPSTLVFEPQHPLVAFLRSSGWVIDSQEYVEEPGRYGTAFGPPEEGVLPQNALVVPLDLQGHLLGFVLLGRPDGLPSLNFEDHDILKTAGRQVAAALAQVIAQDKLSETKQFEALNKLSTFLMHDLKNIVAEQDLVLANAQRFRHRPEFIDDAFATIRGGTERIKKVLERLAAASRTKPPPGKVDVSKLLMEVRSQCADRTPIPEIDVHAQAMWVRMDREELASVLLHIVRNAQDATPPDGQIRIVIRRGSADVLISISDTGCGMDVAFIRDRLFRPFDTTKGEAGMGIGAYQARDIVRRAGGEIDVTSQVGRGTTFSLRLPLAAPVPALAVPANVK